MNCPKIQPRLKVIACLCILISAPVFASIDCASLPQWVTLNNGLQVNQHHIFAVNGVIAVPKIFIHAPVAPILRPLCNSLFRANPTQQEFTRAVGHIKTMWVATNSHPCFQTIAQ